MFGPNDFRGGGVSFRGPERRGGKVGFRVSGLGFRV